MIFGKFVNQSKISSYLKVLPYGIISLLPIFILLFLGIVNFISNPVELDVYYSQRTLVLLIKTLLYGMAVSCFVSVSGLIGGIGILSMKPSLRLWMIGLLMVMVPIPASIFALMWMEIFSWMTNYGLDVNQIGWGVSFFVQSMYLLPISVLICYSGMLRIPQLEIDIARIIRPDWEVFLKIWIPLCKPVVLLVAMVTFLLTISDYSIPAAYAMTIYPMEIFARYSISLNVKDALMSSLPLLIIGIAVVFPLAKIIKNFYMNTTIKSNTNFINDMPFIKRYLSKVIVFFLIIMNVLPVIYLFSRFEVSSSGVFAGGFREIMFTFVICFLAALFSLPIMWLTSEFLYQHKKYLGIILIPGILSPALIGAGLIKMWNHEIVEWIYLSPMMPILAIMIRFMPFGILVILGGKTKMLQELVASGYMKSKSRVQVFFHITLPMMLPTIGIASGIVFLLGIGELGTTIMVLPPGLSTITVKIFGYLHYGASEQIGTMSIWVMLIIFTFSIIGGMIVKKGGHYD